MSRGYGRNSHSDFNWVAFIISMIVLEVIWGLLYFLILPPINLGSNGFWGMLLLQTSIITLACFIGGFEDDCLTAFGIFGAITLILFVAFVICALASGKMLCADAHQTIARIETDGVFTDDIPEIKDWNDIPVIDKVTAQKLGDRSMGEMEQYISQYEVSNEYNLINYNGTYYRVSPLIYGSFWKYFNSKDVGIPAYILVDVYTGKVDLVELEAGKTIQYSPSAKFSKNLTRHIRGEYPTAILGEANFEIDDEGNPFYIVSTLKANAGTFGAVSIDKVLLVDACTGKISVHTLTDVPEWVDNVYDVSRVMEEIDWAYELINGYFNFSKRDVRKTSYEFDESQYYAIPKDDHVYIYTGVTSAGADEANIGFLLIDMRTGIATYYADPGAEESSAQASAKGLFPEFSYTPGPVMLVNINGEQTYFFTLKDAQMLIKKYALVNKTDYTICVAEDSIEAAVKAYRNKLNDTGTVHIEAPESNSITGIVREVYTVTLDGNTMFIFYLEGKNELFISTIKNSYEQPAKLIPTAKVTVGYNVENSTNIVARIDFK